MNFTESTNFHQCLSSPATSFTELEMALDLKPYVFFGVPTSFDQDEHDQLLSQSPLQGGSFVLLVSSFIVKGHTTFLLGNYTTGNEILSGKS